METEDSDGGRFVVSFDPRIKSDRQAVRQLLKFYEAVSGPLEQHAALRPVEANANLESPLLEILQLACGKLLVEVANHVGADTQFDMKELAERTPDVDLDTILSWNRTLGNSCQARSIKKQDVLTEHGGNPKRFSMPQAVYGIVRRLQGENVA